MKYFNNFPYSAESLKNEYRELCKKLHPDTGGNAEEFKTMSAEYEQIARNLNGTRQSDTTHDDSTTAQDFADLMGTPLKGTAGKTFTDLVLELISVISDDARRTAYEEAGETWGCYGWDGCSMTPESRTAYLKKFGRAILEMAEYCAKMKIKEDRKSYEQTKHAAHIAEARKHEAEGNKAPSAGAFVFGICSGLKSDGGAGVFNEFRIFASHPEWITEEEGDERGNLCKVSEVIEVSAEDFARPELADELVQRAKEAGREFAGGSATDDPEPADDPRDPYAKYKYYYTVCAAVVCRESGRWYLIDSEGYSYARYCYMPRNWRTMYAQEIREAQDRHAAQVEQERQEEEQKAAQKLAEYRKKCAKYEGAGLEDLTPYREAVTAANAAEHEAGRAHGWRSPERKAAGKKAQAAGAALTAAEKRNIKAMAAHIFPGIKCKVTKADNWRGVSYTLTYEDGPLFEDFTNNTDFDLFAAYWTEYRMDDCTESHRYDLTEFADKYGDGHGVEIVREMSQAERERMTAAILQAVPAAAGCCYENRHEWTREEVEAAGVACGVDGYDLWRLFDSKSTYFNYITADNLAEWAHSLTAYEMKAASTGRKESRRKSAPAETAAESAAPETATETAAPAEGSAPAAGLELVDIAGGVAVVGSDTYRHRKAIKATGCKWNRDAKRWEATTPEAVAAVRAWFGVSEDAAEPETVTAAETATESAPAEDVAEPETVTEQAGELSPLFCALGDLLAIVADIMQQAQRWEGVTVPAETLTRWKQETAAGTKTAAARFCEVCACLGSLTPESRRDFDALGAIFWSLSEQLKQGAAPETISSATEYARRQLFELISRTQTTNQARAVQEATDPDSVRRAA